jgi:hypothetical protein
MESGAAAVYINSLVSLGIVQKETPVNEKPGSKKQSINCQTPCLLSGSGMCWEMIFTLSMTKVQVYIMRN